MKNSLTLYRILKLCCWTSSLPHILIFLPSFKDTLSWYRFLFSEWAFKNIAHWRSISMALQPQPNKHSSSYVDSKDTSSSTYHLRMEKRSKLPLLFGSTFCRWPASSSLWDPYSIVSIKQKNFDNGRTLAFPLYILRNSLAADLEKYE